MRRITQQANPKPESQSKAISQGREAEAREVSQGRAQRADQAGASASPKPKPQTARHTTHPPVPCLGRILLIYKVYKAWSDLWRWLRPALRRPILARLRRATAACTGGRPGARGRGSTRCIRRFSWTVGAEEMRDGHHDIERLLSPEDVACVCGLSRRAVYRAIARGELRAARLCHRLLVHPAELERWIAEETDEAANSPAPKRTRRRAGMARGGLRALLLDEAAEG